MTGSVYQEKSNFIPAKNKKKNFLFKFYKKEFFFSLFYTVIFYVIILVGAHLGDIELSHKEDIIARIASFILGQITGMITSITLLLQTQKVKGINDCYCDECNCF